MTIQWFVVISIVGILIGMATVFGVTQIAAYLHERSIGAARAQTMEESYFAEDDILANLTLIKELQKELREELRPEITAVNQRLEKIESSGSNQNAGNREGTGKKRVKQPTRNPEVA